MNLEQAAQIFTIAASLSQVILVGGLYIAWTQVNLTLQETRLRSRREAGSFAVTQANVFATKIIPSFSKIHTYLKSHVGDGLSLENFYKKEVPNSWVPKLDRLMKELTDFQIEEIMSIANEIESMAVSFTKGLADEEIVFGSMGEAYCGMVEEIFFYYCLSREGLNPHSYQDTLDLYTTWKNRFKKAGFEERLQKMNAQKNRLIFSLNSSVAKSTPIKTIGTE